MTEPLITGLVLTGGGARAAYQVGVLKAIAAIRRGTDASQRLNPFPVICGTSAGAINASALACNADHFEQSVQGLVDVWSHFSAEQVYRADSLGVIRSGAQWLTMLSIGWVLAKWRRARPRSLLNNAPLLDLLKRAVPLERLPRLLRSRQLRALALSTSSYSSGEHVTFYDSAHAIETWTRSQRVAVACELTHEHLMASSAIPFVFPAVELPRDGQLEWFGDGSMRQTAPISPAIHLGAQRVLVIGAGRMHEPTGRRVANTGYPSLAQVAGHALSGIFLDALAVDIERMHRINRTLALLPPSVQEHTPLRHIEVMVIAPTQRLDDIAAQHQGSLPVPVRAMFRGMGVTGEGRDARGAALASYLLFEQGYTRELMSLGEADTMARAAEVRDFFGWNLRHESVSQF
ncbi:MAG: patatin-like phospholipase family protein [Aquabacterium sp.]